MTSETLSFPDHKLQFTRICLLKFYTELGLQRKRCFISLKYDEKITNYIIFYVILRKCRHYSDLIAGVLTAGVRVQG